MPIVARILIAAAVLCLVAWGMALSVGLLPFLETKHMQVLYGDEEEFFADGTAYHKAGNASFLLLHLPQARQEYRWWTVDLSGHTIARSAAPRSLGRYRFMIRGDLAGPLIDFRLPGGQWIARFSDRWVSFSGNGFTCRIAQQPSL